MSKGSGDCLSFARSHFYINELRSIAENTAMLHGEGDQQTILAWFALATALEDNGEIIEAGEILIHALEKMEIDPGFEHPHTLIIATKVAIFLRDKGNFDSSEKMFERILKTLECAPHPDYDFIFTNLSAMGSLMEFADRLPEAAELHKRALEGRTGLFGPEHERTRFSALRLAAVLEKMQQPNIKSAT
jgi:hypothetical protein